MSSDPVAIRIIWDSYNLAHIAKHGIRPSEVKAALSDPHLLVTDAHSGRVMFLGRAGLRLLAIIAGENHPEFFYVISARDMAKPERRMYREAQPKEVSPI